MMDDELYFTANKAAYLIKENCAEEIEEELKRELLIYLAKSIYGGQEIGEQCNGINEYISKNLANDNWIFTKSKYPDIFNNESIRTPDASLIKNIDDIKKFLSSCKIKASAIKEWRIKEDSHSDYFHGEDKASSEESKAVYKGYDIRRKYLKPLHKHLTENGCIENIEFNNFIKSFVEGEGSINWLKGGNQLGYFVSVIKNKGVIANNENWKIAEKIFLVKGKAVKGDTIKSGATQIIDGKSGLVKRNKALIDSIIKEVLSID